MMKLSVIIVNYNVKFYLEQCLRSVRKALVGIDAEVIVIDNHSRDGSVEYLSERFPDYTFIVAIIILVLRVLTTELLHKARANMYCCLIQIQ